MAVNRKRGPAAKGSSLLALNLLLFASSTVAQAPRPIVATTSPGFLGYDGSWSAISIRVGTPQQYLAVLPNTLRQETWVVGPAGCDGTSTCATLRGGLFSSNESSSFTELGFFELNNGDSNVGYYGLDTIHLQDDAQTSDQIIALVNDTSDWIGTLGLGVQQSRFQDSQNELPFLSSLVENGSLIPSHSYGYTAGASYRLKSVPASLVLGGFDANRFEPNNMTFTLSSGYRPIVAINSFTVSSSPPVGNNLPSNWASNPLPLQDASEAELYTIDSSTPFLWMPPAICDKVADALNLTYDDSLDLYLFDNSSSPSDLVSWGLTFTFSLGNLRGDDANIDIRLPYSAFNLQLSYPFPNLNATFGSPPTNYFPLRRTSDSTQYAIGRAFLQETYLAVDYERNNFSISQAVFTEAAVNTVNLHSISRPDGSIWPGPDIPIDTSLSTGAKAGIGVAVVAGLVLSVLGVWFFFYRKKRSQDDNSSSSGEKSKRSSIFERLRRTPESKSSISELAADKHYPREVPADSSNSRFEMSSGNVPVEMAAAEEVSSTFLAGRRDQSGTSPRNDPRNPAELEPQDIRTKAAEAAAMADVHGSQRSASPVPPYSPNDSNDRNSSSVSPFTPRHSHAFGTISSSEAGISPVHHSSRGYSQPSNSSGADSSPISPEDATQMTLPHSTDGSGGSASAISGRFGNLTVPQFNGRPPSRSPSTGSRFVEQGLSSVEEEEQHQQLTPIPPAAQPTRPTMERARFSWEQ
ncbi:hypothetical protein PV10_05053 [Exophiala mesophila]|uniref:Peptidase A1 domain-containing protein n=1 Tax=Exophiala mesophila TaxID=212818 RepID=A0A0D1ZIW5_EXOME|nr:uncharacterized protein PV10_05053 [Exophiala mesophila]KIV93874.1 hypothetical protein PV10_05053 [Exophiala mesophila]